MKGLVFDTSSIISITMNDLLWVLKPLKEAFQGEFYIPDSVKVELVDKALQIKRFKFEAMVIRSSIEAGDLTVYQEINTNELLEIANKIYYINNKPIHVLDKAEIEALALAVRLNALAYVVDERTIRLLLEDHHRLADLLANKLHNRIDIDENNVKRFKEMVPGIPVVRSAELITVAYERGILDKYAGGNKKELIDALLWGLRLRGCAISNEEIDEIIGLESKNF